MSSRNNKIQVQVFNDSNQKPVPRTKIQEVVRRVFASEGIKEAEVNVIIVTDERIHEMNGKINIMSQSKRGTTLTIQLPIRK